MAKTIDYEFKRGDTKVLSKFRPIDSNGEVLELSALDNIYFTMKDPNKAAVVKKSVGNGIALGEDGYYHITLEAEDTQDLDAITYSYDIELDLQLETLFVKTLIEGEINLLEDVTMKGDR